MGKHAKTKTTTTTTKIATISTLALGGAAVPLLAAPAHAADMAKWDCIASYESGNSDGLDDGVWNLPTGDADSTGGLQIQDRTWADFGGTAIAPHAYQATKAQQIAIAEKILAAQGPGAWTTASMCDGVGSWTGTPNVSTPAPTPTGTTAPATGATAGGTLDPITGVKVPAPKPGSPADLAVKYAIHAISLRLPYVLGGNGPQDGGYDCSGLTSQAWKAAGVDFTDSARDSYSQEVPSNVGPQATAVNSVKDLRPGDLVTYDGFAGGHVALYVGPIGPQGQDLIETNSRHSPGSVDWSFMDSRSGRGPENRTAMTRPAPFVASDGSTSTGGGTGTPAPTPTPAPPPVSTPPSPGNSGGHRWHHGRHHHGKPSWSHAAPVSARTYTVQQDDWLIKISRHQLGDASRWREIYDANKTVIGSDPNLIQPGMVLTLPSS